MTPPDAAVREAVRTRLGETMFVEAGAGSGKTTCLVARFVGLVEAGVEADRIAAITFTEKAAGELADRIRNELQKRSATSARCRAALPALDRAAICTLHAFAQRLLSEHPIEAGLPPRVTVLDEIASQLAFEVRWEAFEDRIIEDHDLERPLRLLLAAGARVDHLHQVAVQFGDNWDLVEERTGEGRPGRAAPGARSLCLARSTPWSAMGGQCRDGDRQASGPPRSSWPSGRRAAGGRRRRQPARAAGPGTELRLWPGPAEAGNWPDINRVRDQVRALEAVRDERTRSGPAGVPRTHRRRAGPLHGGRRRGAAAGGRAGVPRPAGAGPVPAA